MQAKFFRLLYCNSSRNYSISNFLICLLIWILTGHIFPLRRQFRAFLFLWIPDIVIYENSKSPIPPFVWTDDSIFQPSSSRQLFIRAEQDLFPSRFEQMTAYSCLPVLEIVTDLSSTKPILFRFQHNASIPIFRFQALLFARALKDLFYPPSEHNMPYSNFPVTGIVINQSNIKPILLFLRTDHRIFQPSSSWHRYLSDQYQTYSLLVSNTSRHIHVFQFQTLLFTEQCKTYSILLSNRSQHIPTFQFQTLLLIRAEQDQVPPCLEHITAYAHLPVPVLIWAVNE